MATTVSIVEWNENRPTVGRLTSGTPRLSWAAIIAPASASIVFLVRSKVDALSRPVLLVLLCEFHDAIRGL